MVTPPQVRNIKPLPSLAGQSSQFSGPPAASSGGSGLAAVQGFGTALDAFATFAAGRTARQQADQQADILNLQAQDALNRGRFLTARTREAASATTGTQRANIASQSIDLTSGTALALQLETAEISERDVVQIQNNAAREAWGFRTAANRVQFEGKMAERQANFKAATSILSSLAGFL